MSLRARPVQHHHATTGQSVVRELIRTQLSLCVLSIEGCHELVQDRHNIALCLCTVECALTIACDLDEEQEKKLEREFAREYQLITREDRLTRIAEDIVEHFMGREQQGKAMVVCIDKATAVKMYDKVQKHWKAYLRDLPDAELNLLDTGHFALEEDGDLIAEKIRNFLGRHIR